MRCVLHSLREREREREMKRLRKMVFSVNMAVTAQKLIAASLIDT